MCLLYDYYNIIGSKFIRTIDYNIDIMISIESIEIKNI